MIAFEKYDFGKSRSMIRKESWWVVQRDDIKAVMVIVIFYAVMEWLGITCPIKFLLGISCAGCGMSRAWLSLLHLDFITAFYYHPLFILPIPAIILLIFRFKMERFLFRIGIGLICGVFIIVYFIRLLSPDNAIVVFEPKQGFLWKMLFETLNRLK